MRFPEADLGLSELLELAQAARPDLQRAEALARAVEVDHERAAWGWLLPEVRVGAGYGGFGPTPSAFDDQEQ